MTTILALDVGDTRIGVAAANSIARIASPLVTLHHTDTIFDDIQETIISQGASLLVVGLPRGLDGQETAQTEHIRAFAAELRQYVTIPMELQDEALTSQKAEAELDRRKKPYSKGDIDALAAAFILEDYLGEHAGELS